MNYENIRKVGSDSFSLKKLRSSNKSLQSYLNQFNIDDYWIIKMTRKFRFLDKQDIEKWGGFLLLKKDKYKKEIVIEMLDFLNGDITFFDKPYDVRYIKKRIVYYEL